MSCRCCTTMKARVNRSLVSLRVSSVLSSTTPMPTGFGWRMPRVSGRVTSLAPIANRKHLDSATLCTFLFTKPASRPTPNPMQKQNIIFGFKCSLFFIIIEVTSNQNKWDSGFCIKAGIKRKISEVYDFLDNDLQIPFIVIYLDTVALEDEIIAFPIKAWRGRHRRACLDTSRPSANRQQLEHR